MRGPDRTLWVLRACSLFGLSCLLAPEANSLTRTDLVQRYATVVSRVRPVQGQTCESRGSGLYIGHGIYLTAAHVLLDLPDLAQGCLFRAAIRAKILQRSRAETPFTIRVDTEGRPSVGMTVVAKGQRRSGPVMSFPNSADFALLRADGAAPADAVLTMCPTAAVAGQPVVVLLRDGPVATAIAPRQTAKDGDDARYIDLVDVFDNGTSGAGVLDAETLCVMGIVSHRYPEPHPTVTRMAPAAVFADAWTKAVQ